jgi:hypothetical protein
MTSIYTKNLQFDSSIEALYASLNSSKNSNDELLLNIDSTNWVCPYGIASIITSARIWYDWTNQKTILTKTHQKIFSYLERMDVFDVCSQFLSIDDTLPAQKRFDRSENSQKLLEVLVIPSDEQSNSIVVKQALRRAKEILQTWLNEPELVASVLTLLSEISHNITHSQDEGFAIIQRYKQSYSHDSDLASDIHIVIADLGIGIEQSLTRQHPHLSKQSDNGSDFIIHALKKGPSGMPGIRGLGLNRVKNLVQKWNGELIIRSMNSKVQIRNKDYPIIEDELPLVPGVQVSIIVRGKAGIP